MSVLIDVADAVVASLNAGSFSQEFTAKREYQPAFELSELATLKVSVVPKSVTITTASRGESDFDCAVDIGVQRKVDLDEAGVLDGLMALAEEIVDHLRMSRLEDCPAAAWLSIENEPVFAPEHLDQQRVFTSVLTTTYRVRR